KAGTRPASVDELVLVVVGEHQRSYRIVHGSRANISDNDKLLAQYAFRFEPVLAAAGAIRKIDAFRDDALKTHAAGMVQDCFPILCHVIAVLDDRRWRQRLDDRF